MALQNTGTQLTANKYGHLLASSKSQVLNTIASARWTNVYEIDLTFTDSCTDSRVFHSSGHIISRCRHAKNGIKRLRAGN